MPGAVRRGDFNSAGGAVTGPCAPSVRINGRPVSVTNDSVTAHPCCGSPGCGKHCSAKTGSGSSTVRAEGKGIVYKGLSDSCGHARSSSSTNVYVAR